jgi:ABC-type antimicrobial peptide transport system ATPase subunit
VPTDPPPPPTMPMQRLRPARSAEVSSTTQGPKTVSARGVSGTITQARGPWRYSGEWWDQQKWSNEEWEVQLPHQPLLRLRRQPNGGEWSVEGLFG